MDGISEDLQRQVFAMLRRFKQEQYLPLISPEGVTLAEANVLLAIYMTKRSTSDPVQPRLIAKGLHQTPSALSQTLKSLDAKGYINRARLAGDSRAVSLELTASGMNVAKEVGTMREQHFGELLAYIGREDIDHMLRTFEKILDFHREMAEAGKMKRIEGGCGAGHGSHMPDPFLPDIDCDGPEDGAPETPAANQGKQQAPRFEHSVQNLSAPEKGTACE